MDNEFRILIADDNPSIHEDYSQILNASPFDANAELSELIGISSPPKKQQPTTPTYRLDHAYQGEEAIELVKQSIADECPYALVFMDVRMPPGLDGVDTIARIWAIDPHIEMVICTAFSDYSWEKVIARLGTTNQLMILKKPFDVIEVKQMALSLTSKWQLAHENRGLIAELEEDKRELAEAHLAAEQSSQIKSDFIAIISHELKTPLTAILGYTDLVLNSSAKAGEVALSENNRDSVGRIDINARKLSDLIKDILLVSEIESGSINCSTEIFYPHQVVERIIAGFDNLITKKNLTINNRLLSDENYLNSDRIKFETIVSNLIANAIKFTEDGTITIDSRCDKTHFYISVHDTGIGIPKDKFNIIFEKFRQVDQSLTRGYNGTGIGLAIALRMSQMLGGIIELDSEEGKGSTFTFSVKRNLEK